MKLAYEVLHPPGNRQINSPPVVMLHGMLDSRKTWKYIAPKIAEYTGRVVYIVDERNHGESPWSNEMDWSILADDVGDFLTQNHIPKAVLVGHSMGGIASFTFALRKPEMVDKLIVEDISVRPIRLKDGTIIVQIINLLRDSLSAIPEGADAVSAKRAIIEYVKTLLPEEQTPSFPSFDLEMMPLKKYADGYRWQANLDVIEQFLTTERLVHDVSKTGVYNGDSLFLYGTKSFFKVHRDPMIEKLFPQVLKIGFEGGTHLLHHEYPKKFVNTVCNFINNGPLPMAKI